MFMFDNSGDLFCMLVVLFARVSIMVLGCVMVIVNFQYYSTPSTFTPGLHQISGEENRVLNEIGLEFI